MIAKFQFILITIHYGLCKTFVEFSEHGLCKSICSYSTVLRSVLRCFVDSLLDIIKSFN